MYLVMGVVSVCLAALFFGVLLIACRKPKTPMWAPDWLVDTIYVPITVGLLVMGACFLVQGFATLDPTHNVWLELLISLAIILFSVSVLYLMRIKKKLARYAALEAEAERKVSVIAISPEAPRPESTKPTPSRPKRMAA